MSEHTCCNYCIVEDLKKVAFKGGGAVTMKPRPTIFAEEGVDVFIRYPNDAKPTWVAWVMKLPDHCVC